MSPKSRKSPPSPPSPPKSNANKRARNGADPLRNSIPGIALVLASMLPVALSSRPVSTPPTAPTAISKSAKGKPKEFSIPLSNLRNWANSVVVTMTDVRIEGNSNVHTQEADCELHFGAHSSNYQGDPDGLVLEPMNACIQPFPGKTEQKNADWTAFAKKIKDTTVTVTGVPRIWPEHLSGGTSPSNPDHAVEFHPLTSVVTSSESFDFAPNVFAGEYEGGVGEDTALKIAQNTFVTVTRVGDSAEISFRSGQIGNFTVLDLLIDRDSITSDGAGSFRMDGEVISDDATVAFVHIVTAQGSPINAAIEKAKGKRRKSITMQALVLFSLSPKALLDAANKSNGTPVDVEKPLQLVLYGPPDGN